MSSGASMGQGLVQPQLQPTKQLGKGSTSSVSAPPALAGCGEMGPLLVLPGEALQLPAAARDRQPRGRKDGFSLEGVSGLGFFPCVKAQSGPFRFRGRFGLGSKKGA